MLSRRTHPRPTVTALSRSNRRLTLLFVAAVLLPCAVLVVLTLLAMRQEQELAAKRSADQQRAMTAQARQALRSHLDAIVMRELRVHAASERRPYVDSSVTLIADVDGRRLILPWQRRRSPSSSTIAPSVELARRAERQEFQDADPAGAAELWRRAIAAGGQPEDVAVARLGLARVLGKLGRGSEARAAYNAVLDTPPSLTDEHGVP